MNFSDETNQAPETDGKYPQETPHKSNPPASRPKREDVSKDMPTLKK